jgi:hypothetical protein
VATRVAVVISILLGLKGLGLFNRTSFEAHGGRSSLRDLVGFHSPGMFIMLFVNRGATSVTFYDFEIAQPRLGSQVLDADGNFVLHTGAAWYVDGVRKGTFPAMQAHSKINYDTRRVVVEPGSSRTEVFYLELFEIPEKFGVEGGAWPEDFAPILEFEDSFGTRYVADEKGTRIGRYAYPHQTALDAVLRPSAPPGVSRRRWLPFLWWRTAVKNYPT